MREGGPMMRAGEGHLNITTRVFDHQGAQHDGLTTRGLGGQRGSSQ